MRAVAACSLAVLMIACARPHSGDIPKIRYGSDTCARCGMIVNEERFATGYVDERGESVAYDDIGEFLETAAERPEIVALSFVHDAASGRWLRASQAAYVKIPGLATPMGSGFAAISTKEEAQTFARRLGATASAVGIYEAIGSIAPNDRRATK